jgi:hypothetical protein
MVGGLVSAIPSGCESLCWFRFPCDDDKLAWRWPTLADVMNGRVPKAEFVMHASRAADGTMDIILANQGTDQSQPEALRLCWHGARLIGEDTIGGWRLEREGNEAVLLRPPEGAGAPLFFPGDSARIGWLRLDAPAAIEAAPVGCKLPD